MYLSCYCIFNAECVAGQLAMYSVHFAYINSVVLILPGLFGVMKMYSLYHMFI